MEHYATALVPDFAQYYGLRLTEVVATYEPCEAVLLIAGLPGTSRYAARLSGEPEGGGWGATDWLALDTRNALEAIRATVANMASGKAKAKYREWEHYPGYAKAKGKAKVSKMDKLRSLAAPTIE